MNITEVVTYTIPHTRRREELSICNIFFAFLVILIHLLAEPVSGFQRDSFPYFIAVGLWRLSSFVVQGYFFLSGAKLFLGGVPVKATIHGPFRPWLRFYTSRFRRVVLPYLCIFIIFLLYFAITGSHFTPSAILYQFFTGKLCGHFYYVILICQFYILMPLWQRILQKSHPVFLLPIAMLVTIMCKIYMPSLVELLTGQPFDDNGLLFSSYLFYFLAGASIGPLYDRFRVFLAEQQRSLVIGWCFLGISNWILYWLMSRGYFYLPWLELYHMLYCLYAITASLSLAAKWQCAHIFHTKLFSILDRCSYHVYLLHPLAIFIFNTLLTSANITSLSVRFVILFCSTYGLMILFSIIFDKTKYLVSTTRKKAR